jgi:hypothetical protein
MNEMEIQNYARHLQGAHGDKAVAEAAQKARAMEKLGKSEEAKIWRRVEAALSAKLGPHQS